MLTVLEGGDVEYHPTLFDNSSTPAGGADHSVDAVTTFPDGGESSEGGAELRGKSEKSSMSTTENFTFDYFADRYEVKLDLLPSDIAAMVPMVTQFSTRCLQSGASTRLVTSFDGMAAIMLAEVGKAQQERMRKEAEQTPEQLMAALEERQKNIRKEAVEVREMLRKNLAALKAAPPDKKGRDLDIRTAERGIAEMDAILREFSE
jgi:hypothetical protein